MDKRFHIFGATGPYVKSTWNEITPSATTVLQRLLDNSMNFEKYSFQGFRGGGMLRDVTGPH